MSTALAKIDRSALVETLGNSLYPGASANSIGMVLGYCEAAGLDPMQKPVHIVEMWDNKIGQKRDVVMPGIGLYRVQASRTGQFGGISEPEFGPDKEFALGGVNVTAPEWCKITVKRVLAGGYVAEFHATEYWIENYAQKGGKEKSIAPNAMWSKRPRGQLAKCAEAQALRKAFPEIGAAPTAEEMEGKQFVETGDAIPAVATVDVEDWTKRINDTVSEAAARDLWKEAVEACRVASDKEAHKTLGAVVAARIKALQASPAIEGEPSND